jgi:hypothetical protein
MERRKFLRNGDILASFFGAGVAVASESVPTPSVEALPVPVKEDVSHLAPPQAANTLHITGSYSTDEVVQERMRLTFAGSLGIGTSPYLFHPMNQVVTHSVSLAVGKDNRLWMKVGDTWHRVALES